MIIPLNKKNLFALLVWGLYTLMSYYLFSSVTCFYHLTLFLRFVHVDALSCSFSHVHCCAICHCMNIAQFIHFPVHGHLGCFQFLFLSCYDKYHCHKHSYACLLTHRKHHFLTSPLVWVWHKWSKKRFLWSFMFFRVIHVLHTPLLVVLTSSWSMTPMVHFGRGVNTEFYLYCKKPTLSKRVMYKERRGRVERNFHVSSVFHWRRPYVTRVQLWDIYYKCMDTYVWIIRYSNQL